LGKDFEISDEGQYPKCGKPALEKFMLSLSKYAGFACASAMLSM
jgi:hypothetical protein